MSRASRKLALGAAGAAGLAVIVAAGCGEESGFGPPGAGAGHSTGSGISSGAGAGNPGDPCSPELSKKSCHVTIGSHNGVTNCLDGIQVCLEGHWSNCTPGSLMGAHHRPGAPVEDDGTPVRPVPSVVGGLPRLLNATTGSCNDSCDPSCVAITETNPPGGTTTTTASNAWVVPIRSSVTGAQASLSSKGYSQPCGAAWDCEFDQYCQNPVTTGAACPHDKCAPGAGISLLCNDSCVQAVIGQHVGCALTWDATCVQAVHDVCGLTCVNNSPGCSHDLCITGGPLQDSCDNVSPASSCVHQVCAAAATSYCCNQLVGQWDSTCVNAMNAACGTTCPLASQKGICQPWTPSVVDGQCVGKADLTANIVCTEKPNGPMPNTMVVPVCNVGTVTTSGNININTYSPGTSNIPGATPTGTITGTCSSTSTIPPGKCIDVPCNVNPGDVVFVNPGQTIPECDTRNNWSISLDNQGPAIVCDAPSCQPQGNLVWTRPTHMFITVDASSAVPSAGNHYFQPITQGMHDFFNDPAAQAMNAYVQGMSFPKGAGCTSATCPPATGCTSGIGLTALTGGNAGALGGWATGLTLAAGPPPTGAAPYAAGLGSALSLAVTDTATSVNPPNTNAWLYPDSIVVLILASDPTVAANHPNCGTTWNMNALAGQAATAYQTSGVRTFVIAAGPTPETAPEDASRIAAAGHGVFYDTTSDQDGMLQSDIHQALLDIVQNQAYPCYVDLPPLTEFDISSPAVNVLFPPGGVPANLTQVMGGYTNCTGNGFYYWPSDAAPTQIRLCPQTCQAVATAVHLTPNPPAPAVSYKTNCAAIHPATTVNGITYTAGACPEGSSAQWRWFSYDTTTPAGTDVQFFVQTPTMANPLQIADANNPDPSLCQAGGPAGCPVDLVAALDGSGLNGPAFAPTITVSANLNPNANQTASPTINSYQVEYSCVPNQ